MTMIFIAYVSSLLVAFASLSCAFGQFGENVVVNGGGELNDDASCDCTANQVISGWTRMSGVIGLSPYSNGCASGAQHNPSLTTPGPATRGQVFFYGGCDSSSSSMYQNINVSSLSKSLYASTVHFNFSAYLGGNYDSDDRCAASATFKSLAGIVLLQSNIGPVHLAERGGISGVFYRSAAGVVPIATTAVGVTLECTRAAGSFLNGYADNIELVFTESAPPVVSFGANVVVNGGGEENVAATCDCDGNQDIYGWTRSTGNVVLADYSAGCVSPAPNNPSPASPGPVNRGQVYFHGGCNAPSSSIYQNIVLAPISESINAGVVHFNVSAYLGGDHMGDDRCAVNVTFKGVGGATLSQMRAGPVYMAERGSVTGMLYRSAAGVVPVASAVAVVMVECTRAAGNVMNGYADNIELVFTDSTPSGDVLWAREQALQMGATPSQALQFLYWEQVKALKLGATVEQALKFRKWEHTKAFAEGATAEQALQFTTWEQTKALAEGATVEQALQFSTYEQIKSLIAGTNAEDALML